MLISDVLQTKGRKVVTIRPDQTVKDAVERMAEHRIGALVVESQLKPVGIFSESDLVDRLAKSGAAAYDYQVREVMSSPAVSGSLTDTIDQSLELMTHRRIRHLPILVGDELVGLVSLGDLVKHRLEAKELEANVLLDMTRMRS